VKRLLLVLLLLRPSVALRADDNSGEVETCTFVAHTPVGTLNGKCTTQNLPEPGFREHWKLTLTFDSQSVGQATRVRPDQFYDMFRAQSLEEGGSTLILPLWGDFLLIPDDQEYLAEIQATAPLYETRPHRITISQVSNAPLTMEFLFEERLEDFDPVLRAPSLEWMLNYLESFYRLGTNRPDGFAR
jgi:hypothetical protein